MSVATSEQHSGSLMTAGQVARLLGVPTSWVYEQSRRGRIPTVTLGRYRRYRREAIEEWIETLERPFQIRAADALDVTEGARFGTNGGTRGARYHDSG